MRLKIPTRLRYRVVSLLERKPSAFASVSVRVVILVTLILMLVPWRAAREIAFAGNRERSDLKSALRATLWVWNRSWIPMQFKFDTFFDIGWYLSVASCRALSRKGFLSRDPLKRKCDLAQLELSSILDGVRSGNQADLRRADHEIGTLVNAVLNDANSWAASHGQSSDATTQQEPTTQQHAIKVSKGFDNDRTRTALLDFDDLARTLGLRFFLVSGTFLGVVRDRAFIGHDHDIDLGVFEEDLNKNLLAAIPTSGQFFLSQTDHICLRQPGGHGVSYELMDKPAIIRLAHRNGVSVDLFVHFHDGGTVWHGSSVHRWDNEAFPLRDYEFLGRAFKGALDFDRYLTENYGPDWRVPKSKFNVNFDTPNLRYVGSANALVYFAWMVVHAMQEKNVAGVRRYIVMLLELGAVEARDGRLNVI